MVDRTRGNIRRNVHSRGRINARTNKVSFLVKRVVDLFPEGFMESVGNTGGIVFGGFGLRSGNLNMLMFTAYARAALRKAAPILEELVTIRHGLRK